MVDTDKVKSPFSRQQRNQLLAWSKFARESDVLNGYQRKVIYEGGHYNYVFISRLNQITDALRALRDHLEDDEDDLADEILCCSYVCFLEAKAKEGNTEAQYYLGDGLYWGLYRLEEDEPRAATLIEAAAKQGHEEALATIGSWYLHGTVVEADPKIAVGYLNEAHALGNLDAQMQLAFAFHDGKGVERDDRQAYQLLRDAAEAGHVQSMGNVGHYLCFSIGVEEDMDEAMEWWNKAAEHNDDFALYSIGRSFLQGDGVERDAEKAVELFRKAVDFGSLVAKYRLALCLLTGDGCDEDETEAAELFEQAHWEGNINSTYWLGLCCKNGWGLAIDYERAVFLLSECLEAKPEAGFELGECARNGHGTPKNFEAAFDHYLKAAEDGSSEAKAAIGRAFFLGEGVAESDQNAVKWFSLVVDEEPMAKTYLGKCYFHGFGVEEDQKLGISLLREAASEGYKPARETLFDLGFEVEEPKTQADRSGKNIISVHTDRLSRADALYRKAISTDASDVENRSANIINFQERYLDAIHSLMDDAPE